MIDLCPQEYKEAYEEAFFNGNLRLINCEGFISFLLANVILRLLTSAKLPLLVEEIG